MTRTEMKMPSRPVRLAVLCSSAGGVLDALCHLQRGEVWPFEIAGVVTDRTCGAEQVAQSHGVDLLRIEPNPPNAWSDIAAMQLRQWNADAVLLLMLRKIGPVIWRDLDAAVWNLHPSLLPAYPGLNALERNFADAQTAARRGETKWMGVTIHAVNGEIDAGPIINQRRFTISDADTLSRANHACFLFKIALVLECICKQIDGTLPTCRDANTQTDWQKQWKPFRPYEPLTDVMLRFAQPWAASWLNERARNDVENIAKRIEAVQT